MCYWSTTMVRFSTTVAFLSLLALGGTAAAQGLIIESNAAGQNFNKYKELAGNWIDSKNPPTTAKSAAPGLTEQGKCPTRAYVFGMSATTNSAAARFSPEFSSPGHYYVYATWPRSANANPVHYYVKHAKGEDTKDLMQDGWGVKGETTADQWQLIGDYDFSAGGDQYVELRTDEGVQTVDPRNVGRVYSDAVQFSPQPLAISKVKPTAGTGPGGSPTAVAFATPAMPTLTDNSPLEWENSISAASAAAKKSDKNILILFSSEQSTTSNYYENDAFNNPQVKAVLKKNYVLVKVDFPKNSKTAMKLGVFKAGVINMYNSQGHALDQISERLSPAELAQRLNSY